jgi:hypothetical protein
MTASGESFGESSVEVNERAAAAVATFIESLRDIGGEGFVPKFVLLVEIVDEDDRWFAAFTAPGQKAWDSLGLLEFGRSMEWNARINITGEDTG